MSDTVYLLAELCLSALMLVILLFAVIVLALDIYRKRENAKMRAQFAMWEAKVAEWEAERAEWRYGE